jgi:hypothetical protein
MASLLHSVRRGASPETERDQQTVQVEQGGGRRPWGAHLHGRAGRGVEHPARHHRDDAGRCLDMDDRAAGPLLAVVPPQPPPVQRMPAVVDDDLRPDMGRMTL